MGFSEVHVPWANAGPASTAVANATAAIIAARMKKSSPLIFPRHARARQEAKSSTPREREPRPLATSNCEGERAGDQFGLCFETPLRLIQRRPRSGRLEGEAQGLLSMRPN
jgi:hypothetical protein